MVHGSREPWTINHQLINEVLDIQKLHRSKFSKFQDVSLSKSQSFKVSRFQEFQEFEISKFHICTNIRTHNFQANQGLRLCDFHINNNQQWFKSVLPLPTQFGMFRFQKRVPRVSQIRTSWKSKFSESNPMKLDLTSAQWKENNANCMLELAFQKIVITHDSENASKCHNIIQWFTYDFPWPKCS